MVPPPHQKSCWVKLWYQAWHAVNKIGPVFERNMSKLLGDNLKHASYFHHSNCQHGPVTCCVCRWDIQATIDIHHPSPSQHACLRDLKLNSTFSCIQLLSRYCHFPTIKQLKQAGQLAEGESHCLQTHVLSAPPFLFAIDYWLLDCFPWSGKSLARAQRFILLISLEILTSTLDLLVKTSFVDKIKQDSENSLLCSGLNLEYLFSRTQGEMKCVESWHCSAGSGVAVTGAQSFFWALS